MHLVVGFAVAMLLGLGSCAAGEMPPGNFYRGQVIDVDTGKPLGKVLVVFLWERYDYSPTTKRIHSQLHAVTEVLTDADGRFEVSTAPETTAVGPFLVEVRKADPIFFAPGYFLLYKVKTEGDAFHDPTIVYMKRAENPRDAVEPLPLVPSFPFSRTPLLLKALNEERGRLGLPLIQPGHEGTDSE